MGRLFWKFFAFTMLAQLIATIGIGGAIWLKNEGSSRRVEQIDLSPPAAFMIESAASTLKFGGVPALRNLLENMDANHQIFAVNDENMELLGRKLSPEVVNEARNILQSDTRRHEVRRIQALDGHRYLLFLLADHHDGNRFDAGEHKPPDGPPGFHDDHPPPFDDHGRFGHPPKDDHFLPFLPLVSAIFGSLIFSAFLARYFSKPINSLRSAFEAVAKGNLEVGVGSKMGHRRDELTDLGRDFDIMVERLRALLDGQRRFLHDVSHELRSPLARLQVAIGLVRQQPGRMDISLNRIERESDRMDKLVGELLTLSKLEAGVLNPAQEDVNIGELIADVVNDAIYEAEANARKFEFTGSCDVVVKGDAEMLCRAIENVVRNALKHTLIGSAVILESTVDLRHNVLRLAILDRGPGVPDTELKAIFEPFFRSARAQRSVDGHGLGLAIAQRVVTAYGGSIIASNREGGGLCIEILLPFKGVTSSPYP